MVTVNGNSWPVSESKVRKQGSEIMQKSIFLCALMVLGACAIEPTYFSPENQAVEDYIATAELMAIGRIRKYDRDTWVYVNDRYVIYRGRPDDYLMEFRHECGDLRDNSWIPADLRYDHRNLRARVDTLRGCIVEKIYPITTAQRNELRTLGETPGQRN